MGWGAGIEILDHDQRVMMAVHVECARLCPSTSTMEAASVSTQTVAVVEPT